MAPDPRWLEILKASGWQTAAIAGACGIFLIAARWNWFPPLDPWMVQLAAFVLLLNACLTVASFISAVLKFFPLQTWVMHRVMMRREKDAVRNYIPHMTPNERKIIAYLLARNQKMFVAAADDGYAMTLISRGIVVRALRPNQVFDMDDTPMVIPDHVWDVLLEHKREFPTAQSRQDPYEPHPWRQRLI